MSALGDVVGPGDESPTSLALRLCRYMDDENVQLHVKRLMGVDLSLRRVAIIRQGLPVGRYDSARNGYEPSDMPLRINAARRSNRAFTKAILRAAGQ